MRRHDLFGFAEDAAHGVDVVDEADAEEERGHLRRRRRILPDDVRDGSRDRSRRCQERVLRSASDLTCGGDHALPRQERGSAAGGPRDLIFT